MKPSRVLLKRVNKRQYLVHVIPSEESFCWTLKEGNSGISYKLENV